MKQNFLNEIRQQEYQQIPGQREGDYGQELGQTLESQHTKGYESHQTTRSPKKVQRQSRQAQKLKVQEQVLTVGDQQRLHTVNEPDFLYKQSEHLSHLDPGHFSGREELSPEANLSSYF